MEELRQEDPRAERFILVPEAATLLIQAGHRPGTQSFQLAVVRLQRVLERECSRMADPEKKVLICDRSTVDSLAYWLLIGGIEEEFFEVTGMTYKDLYERYDGAIQLQTAAIGALANYRRISEGARTEDAEEAARIDGLCTRVWYRHPRFHLIENTNCVWKDKSAQTRKRLTQLIEEARMARVSFEDR